MLSKSQRWCICCQQNCIQEGLLIKYHQNLEYPSKPRFNSMVPTISFLIAFSSSTSQLTQTNFPSRLEKLCFITCQPNNKISSKFCYRSQIRSKLKTSDMPSSICSDPSALPAISVSSLVQNEHPQHEHSDSPSADTQES